jgi:hypothetical protein
MIALLKVISYLLLVCFVSGSSNTDSSPAG